MTGEISASTTSSIIFVCFKTTIENNRCKNKSTRVKGLTKEMNWKLISALRN